VAREIGGRDLRVTGESAREVESAAVVKKDPDAKTTASGCPSFSLDWLDFLRTQIQIDLHGSRAIKKITQRDFIESHRSFLIKQIIASDNSDVFCAFGTV
jgi:hypothetical protein